MSSVDDGSVVGVTEACSNRERRRAGALAGGSSFGFSDIRTMFSTGGAASVGGFCFDGVGVGDG